MSLKPYIWVNQPNTLRFSVKIGAFYSYIKDIEASSKCSQTQPFDVGFSSGFSIFSLVYAPMINRINRKKLQYKYISERSRGSKAQVSWRALRCTIESNKASIEKNGQPVYVDFVENYG